MESKKFLTYTIAIISMVIPVIIGASWSVTKRLVNSSYATIKLKILSKVAPRKTTLLGTSRILRKVIAMY